MHALPHKPPAAPPAARARVPLSSPALMLIMLAFFLVPSPIAMPGAYSALFAGASGAASRRAAPPVAVAVAAEERGTSGSVVVPEARDGRAASAVLSAPRADPQRAAMIDVRRDDAPPTPLQHERQDDVPPSPLQHDRQLDLPPSPPQRERQGDLPLSPPQPEQRGESPPAQQLPPPPLPADKREGDPSSSVPRILLEEFTHTPHERAAGLPLNAMAQSLPRASVAPPSLPRCPRILLFSAPRHGSTWLIDSAERCVFSQRLTTDGTYGRLNAHSELWNPAQHGMVRELSPEQAGEYIARNFSLKVFPTPWVTRRAGVEVVLRAAHAAGVAIVLLTRRPDDALGSFLVAKETSFWNGNSPNASSISKGGGGGAVNLSEIPEERRKGNSNQLNRFFESVRLVLRERGWRFDEMDYDRVKKAAFIELPNSGCYIKSCNFA